jgi:hypothetical protein
MRWNVSFLTVRGLEDQEKSWSINQESGATVPSGANLCLVSEEVSSLGRPLGAHCRML